MQVGTTKDQGLYNKSSVAVHPGALAAGTLPQYNTVVPLFRAHSSSMGWTVGPSNAEVLQIRTFIQL